MRKTQLKNSSTYIHRVWEDNNQIQYKVDHIFQGLK